MRHVIVYAAVGLVSVALSAPAPAKSGGSKGSQHSDLTVSKHTDKSSPTVMHAKSKGKFKPNSQRYDPYKNYKFR